jgi:polar amino acid transport system substrate-binding protein
LLIPVNPALSNPVAVFGFRERPFEFKSRQDLASHRVGIARGNVFGDGVDEFIKKEIVVEEANTPDQNFEKLALGRIDFFITGYYTGMALLFKRGDEERFGAKSPFLAETPNYLALTRNGKCADKLLLIDSKLAQLKKSGTIDDLIRTSFEYWKAHLIIVQK